MDKLSKLGFDEYSKRINIEKELGSFFPARVTAEHRGLYVINEGEKELTAVVTGKMMFSASSREDFPSVGDWVLVESAGEGSAIVRGILPRATVLKRKSAGRESKTQIIASNIDTAFIMQAVDRDFNPNRIERGMALALSGNIEAEIILNKTDLIGKAELEIITGSLKERFPETKMYAASTVTEEGIPLIKEAIRKGRTYCFIGSSGVGKSSMLNALTGHDLMKTGEISISAEKGRHVTTHRRLFVLEEGGLIIDTPGMREVGLLDAEEGLGEVFSDFAEMRKNCRFIDCTHTHEPGCAVLEGLRNGEVDEERYENYVKLVREERHNTMSSIERKRGEREFGRFKKEYNKQHRNKN